jgi:hypothetical protein
VRRKKVSARASLGDPSGVAIDVCQGEQGGRGFESNHVAEHNSDPVTHPSYTRISFACAPSPTPSI